MKPEPGFLFMCSGDTFRECMSLSLFGESASKLGLVTDAVRQATPLFLLNFSRRTLFGPFYAGDIPQLNKVPNAWAGHATRTKGRPAAPASPAGEAT